MKINADSSKIRSNSDKLDKTTGKLGKIIILFISYSGIQSNLSCSSTFRTLMGVLFFNMFVLETTAFRKVSLLL